jgi:hypothetical protein
MNAVLTVPELGVAERTIWAAYPRGNEVDLRGAADRTVRATLIRSLLLGANPPEPGQLAALRVKGAHITGALDLKYADIGSPLQLEDCQFDEAIDLFGAHLRQLSLAGSELTGLTASTTIIDGNLRLTGCQSRGQIRLLGARISGSLILNSAHLRAQGTEAALQGLRLSVGNDILGMEGLTCQGEVYLNNAEVQGALRLAGAHLSNPGGTALSAIGLTVGAIADCCDGFRAEGKLSFSYAKIGHRLCLRDAQLANPGGQALSCLRIETPELTLLPAAPIDGDVELRHATIGVIRDDPATWPPKLFLDGLRYNALSDTAAAADRLRWVRLDPHGYLPQVYEQLAATYRRQGRESDARRVLLAKQRHRAESLGPIGKIWAYLQDTTVGYGYRPTRAVIWLLTLLALGTIVFGLHHPTVVDPDHGPDFNPFIYALDLLLPIVDFGQEGAFQPHGAQAWVGYGLIAAGWVLATTVAAGATRALRRD